jgi:hypothetical protein
MSEKLLPCPFCGGEPSTFEYDGVNQATCRGKHIDCAGTDVVAPVAMWNRRTPAPEGEVCPHDAHETDIQFEVWQDGDMVATADSLPDAEHFMVIYGQDGSVEKTMRLFTRTFRGSTR